MSAVATRVSQLRDHKLIVEKDVKVAMRDGTIIYADVFRPETTERVPVILNVSVYQKDKLWVAARGPRGEGQSLHELGDGEPPVVVPAQLRLRAHRFARLGKISG